MMGYCIDVACATVGYTISDDDFASQSGFAAATWGMTLLLFCTSDHYFLNVVRR